MIGRALVSRDRALRLNPAFVSFQFPSVLLIYRLVRFSTNSASDHSRLLTPASIAGRARKVWNGATLPSAPVSAKDRNPPISAVRRSCRGSSLAPLAADTRPECVSLKTSLSSGRLHLLSLVRSTRAMQDCSDGILAEPDMAADQPVAQTSLCQLGLSALLGHGNTTSWTNQERASVT
jgi:hypothetical protein